MTGADRYRRVCDLFDAAMDLDPAARAAFLDDACRDAPDVRREVEALLSSLADTPTAELFPPLLAPASSETLAIGQRIGPYLLRREIGAGGMGVVYEAVREDVGMTVALKLVRHGRLASPEHLRRFLLERRVLARLEHPHIARLLDAGVTDSGLPYLVMEYAAGESIDRYCEARRLTIEERLALFAQVCDAVHYAHRHLVVHRDLKPSNIAVTGDGAVKLLDFGIATLLEEGRGEARLTRTGLAMLTPEYAAPEQVKGEPVTTTGDVYALGVLLYELLAGQRPFAREGRTTPELLRAVCETVPEPPSAAARRRPGGARLGRRLAGDLNTIVMKALRKEPERRYHSALELREDIDRHLSGRPVRARGDSLGYRARKFVGRYRAGVAAAALVVVTLAAGVIGTTVQMRRAEAERAVAEQRFRDVRALAGALVADVHDAISDLPGTLPVRATLVTRAIEHLDRLYRQSGDDPGLRREIAAAYVKLGLVQGNPTDANLGDLAAARQSFERALAIARSLIAADSGDRAARRTLALAHEKLSDADAWGGRLPQGIAHARRALEQWQLLAATSPASADAARVGAVRAVAMSHVKLGDLLGNPNLPNLGDRAGAAREYQEALALLQTVPRDSLRDWPSRRLLALLYERLGTMASRDGRPAEGVARLEQALAIREGLVRERGASVNALRDVAVTHQVLCEAQLAAGDGGEALLHCRRGVELYESLRATDPRNAQSLRDLALGRRSMHDVLAARGDLSAALAELDRSTALLHELLSAQAGNVPVRRDLARGLLLASTAHATLAARASETPAARRVHRERAAASFEDGRRLLLAAHEGGALSREDAALLARAEVAVGRGRTRAD